MKIGNVRIACASVPVRVIGRILLLAIMVCVCTVSNSEAKEDANVAALAQLRGLR